ncbi:hypothetical protein [Streptomyces cacaoi]
MGTWQPGQPVTADSTPPLPALPQSPAMRGYAELVSRVEALGFRHLAEVLRPPAAATASPLFSFSPSVQGDDGFLVLDGLWFPARGGLWRRMDLGCLRETGRRWAASGDPRAVDVAAVLDTLETVLRDDAAGLRRVVLWQLCCLLQDGGKPPDAERAAQLGVHRLEATLLARAVAEGFPGPGAGRDAAEEICEVWPGHRLRHALALAARLPADPADHALARVLRGLRAEADETERLRREAAALRSQGRARACAAAWLAVARRAADDPAARTGLLGAAADADADPDTGTDIDTGTGTVSDPGIGTGTGIATATAAGIAAGAGTGTGTGTGSGTNSLPSRARSRVSATVEDRTVRLRWDPPVATTPGARRRIAAFTYRVFRFPEGAPHEAVEVPVTEGAATAVDPAVPAGYWRYAVLPELAGRAACVPRTTAPVALAPPPGQLSGVAVPDGVRLRWRADEAAAEVRAVRLAGPGLPAVELLCGRAGAVDRPLPPGVYRYAVSCCYRAPDGGQLWSGTRTVTVHAPVWPSPVRELTTRRTADGVHISWSPPPRGRGRLVRWRGQPVAAGEDVTALLFPDGPRDEQDHGNGDGHDHGDGDGHDHGDGNRPDDPPRWPAPGTPHGSPQESPDGVPEVHGPDCAEITVPPRAWARMTAVSVLEGRAVAGASVVVEHPGTVTGLVARRLDAGRAEVRFVWPEPTVLVVLRARATGPGGGHTERRVSRSCFLADGRAALAVSADEQHITVAPLPRPDAVVVASGAAEALLPAVPAAPPPPVGPAPAAGKLRRLRARLARAVRPRRWRRHRPAGAHRARRRI